MSTKEQLGKLCREAYHKGSPLSIEEIVSLADKLYQAEIAESAAKLADIKDSLYGQGLQVANWHLNGELEPLDNFFEENGW
tara:strand:+ start:7390 stop:7632 length:243 start_codon:yes stop_codon:yes gene_type:complete